jgi:hypothetical protein
MQLLPLFFGLANKALVAGMYHQCDRGDLPFGSANKASVAGTYHQYDRGSIRFRFANKAVSDRSLVELWIRKIDFMIISILAAVM